MGKAQGKNMITRGILVMSLFAVLTLVMAYPLSWEPGGRALDLGADTRLFLWTLSWDIHALSHRPWSLFDANIFFPEGNTLAYSEHLVGSALVGAPWMAVTNNPLLTLNAIVLLSCLGCGLGAYFLARRLGIGVTGALVAGVIFAFSPPRFFRIGQLHLATVQWIPFCLAFLHTYASGGKLRHLLAASFFFWLQALSGGQSGLYLLLASGGLVAYLLLLGRFRPCGSVARDVVLAGVFTVVLNTPFLLPYFQVQEDLGLRRSLQETEEWSPNGVSFLAAPTHAQKTVLSAVPGLRRSVLEKARSYLFPGFLTLILAAVALGRRRSTPETPPLDEDSPVTWPVATTDTLLVLLGAAAIGLQATGGIRAEVAGVDVSAANGGRAAIAFAILLGLRFALAPKSPFAWAGSLRRARAFLQQELNDRMGVEVGFYAFLAAFSLWASLGPRFGLYAWLYRLIPGFDFIRVPSRLTLLTLLGLAVLAGLGADRIVGTRRRSVRWVGALLLPTLHLLEFAAFPLDARPYPLNIPTMERWLASYPERVPLVALPVPDPRDAVQSARLHSLYMLYSTAHWHELVNGYSGFTPPKHDELFRRLVNFPDVTSLDALEAVGVRLAVLHRDLYSDADWASLNQRIVVWKDRLQLVYEDEGGQIYELIRRASRRASPRANRASSRAW